MWQLVGHPSLAGSRRGGLFRVKERGLTGQRVGKAWKRDLPKRPNACHNPGPKTQQMKQFNDEIPDGWP
ncbi:MAG: hypothetical protein HKN47_02570 [Pirellulaceae bacterium]|nr:hypothetical protein [Pirellulaceae bacterium]